MINFPIPIDYETAIITLNDIVRRSVDGTVKPLFVDYSNQRVGIATLAPRYPFFITVTADQNIGFRQNGTSAEMLMVNDAASSIVTGNIEASPLTLNSRTGGLVGVNMSSPRYPFHVTVTANQELGVRQNSTSTEILFSNAAAATVTGNIEGSPLTLNSRTGGNVGVGGSNPQSAFDVFSGATTVLTMGAWTAYTPTISGVTAPGTINIARYIRIGKTVFIVVDVQGTSTAGTFSITLPVAAQNSSTVMPFMGMDNGTFLTTPSQGATNGNTTLTLYKDWAEANTWTASGTKRAILAGFYEST